MSERKKRPGRPATGLKRPERVVIQCTEAELAEINQAGGSNRQAWLLAVVLRAARERQASE